MSQWFEIEADGVRLRVRLTPRGGADRIDAPMRLSDGSTALAVRVRAAPENGAANAALERLLAQRLGVARRTVTVASGRRARLKRVHVAGDGQALASVLAGWRGDEEGNTT